MAHPSYFDEFAADYDDALNQGLAASGETKDYFARGRIQWLARCLQQFSEQPRLILDYGCGDGSSSELLLAATGADLLVGLDTSEKSLVLANRNYGGKRSLFCSISKYEPRAELDLVYCNGVFHHIPLVARASATKYIWDSLRPGGIFSLWENNPWNPGTRYVMSQIPFDRGAITLTPPEAATLLQDSGFEVLRRDSLFYFPRQLRWLRWIEPHLSQLPLGAQYQILCRKPEKASPTP